MCTDQEAVGASESQRLSDQPAAGLNLVRVDAALAGTVFHGKLHHFPSIDSTQTRAIAEAQAGAESGQVYVADEQTSGRGRGGHTWASEPGNGLYLTVLIRPRLRSDDALTLSFAAGIAAQAAIKQATGAQIDLRWPNDLVTPGPGSLKLGGILTETAMKPDGTLRYAAIGIGINLNHIAMPSDLETTSTSLRRWTGSAISREAVLIAFLQELVAELSLAEHSPAAVLQKFAEHSNWVSGKRVFVGEAQGYTGVTEGLTGAGLLRVRCDDGTEREVRHGGVRERPDVPKGETTPAQRKG